MECCASSTDSVSCLKLVVDVGAYTPGGEFLLPDWLEVVFSSPLSYSKFMGAAVLSSPVFDAVSSSSRSRLDNER